MGLRKQVGKVLLVVGFLSLAGLSLTGCATSTQGAHPPGPSPGFVVLAPEKAMSWWVYRFRINWPVGTSPDWAVDLLLAHAVVKPKLEIYSKRLAYWRFHRRAARDATGHQFSLLFYTDPATARGLYTSLEASPALKQARDQGLVTRVIRDDPETPVRPEVEDTSDPRWSPTLQRHWPSYIMGVSLLWLGLIDDAVAELPPSQRSGEDLLATYRAAENRVSQIWYKEGQHAFFHHLSAVFGYRELLIAKPMRF